MRSLIASALALLLTASGCGTPRPVTSAPHPAGFRMSNVTMGDVFEIPRGGAVLVGGHRLMFEGVVTDSRCPLDVNCVRAGEAIVTFSFVGTRAIGEMRLQIPGYATAETAPQPEQTVTRSGLRFTLLALDPYPGTPEAEADERPVATLRVEQVGG